MNRANWVNFIAKVKQDVVPALGCTEPVSVALASALAVEQLDQVSPNTISATIDSIAVFVSPNLMKNGMGVGVPGTGMVGLPIAAAVGAIAGDTDAELEVLKNITDQDVDVAKKLLTEERVTVAVADVSNILYAKVTVNRAGHFATVTIADSHTKVLSIEVDGMTTYIASTVEICDLVETPKPTVFSDCSVDDLYDFVLNVDLKEIEFISQAYQLNNALSAEGLSHDYGLQVGATFKRNVDRGLLAGGLLTEVLIRTSAASDARMDGAMLPAMSNSGSGNQGIAATMPVVVTAEFIKASHEQTVRALMLSHLMAIYIKSHQNKLSALCGASTASMGAVTAITWLLGGNRDQMNNAINNMIGDVSGMVCDGAKTGCAMKVSSSASAAVKAALMALDNIRVTGNEGIVADDVDHSIANLSALANGSMTQTDAQILDIMVHKA
ncbi:L-serine ammonia-lyase, iron-sulfur-dependent, subunit alpha [Vibrio sp. SS-MA-C1-2]|uniref:L-cysteine desulfidase family protein n=1 Tax=Vibrio sp. SS-MA-C1-2 TaxID=2908646 RepID=UPI001F1ECAF2|nr:L-serine ammonia-lyase, iron-sulfur-dependent, subunit alpha [Vibrio sp. SS-MA-C1-2]UJF19387.1 L-serine ammonia-lyase, iron-sulfur-dependent, subunit alpha [Vibrio sp. SS-MA-C1-2]